MNSNALYPFFDIRTGRRVLEQGHIFVGDGNNIESPQIFSPDLIPLGEGNILVGNRDGVAEESLALKDMFSRLLKLRYELSLIEENATFILQKAHQLLPKAQALNTLPNGILKHKDGIVDTAVLPQGQLYIGDANNEATPTQTISLDNFPNLTYKRIWRGNLFFRPTESDDLTIAEGDIVNLKAQVTTLEEQVATLQAEVAEMQAQIAALQAELAALQAEVAVLAEALAALQAEVAFLGMTVLGLVAAVAGLKYDVYVLGARIDDVESRLPVVAGTDHQIKVVKEESSSDPKVKYVVSIEENPHFPGDYVKIPFSTISIENPEIGMKRMTEVEDV